MSKKESDKISFAGKYYKIKIKSLSEMKSIIDKEYYPIQVGKYSDFVNKYVKNGQITYSGSKDELNFTSPENLLGSLLSLNPIIAASMVDVIETDKNDNDSLHIIKTKTDTVKCPIQECSDRKECYKKHVMSKSVMVMHDPVFWVGSLEKKIEPICLRRCMNTGKFYWMQTKYATDARGIYPCRDASDFFDENDIDLESIRKEYKQGNTIIDKAFEENKIEISTFKSINNKQLAEAFNDILRSFEICFFDTETIPSLDKGFRTLLKQVRARIKRMYRNKENTIGERINMTRSGYIFKIRRINKYLLIKLFPNTLKNTQDRAVNCPICGCNRFERGFNEEDDRYIAVCEQCCQIVEEFFDSSRDEILPI
ncbi:MAG: hypothetical protein LHV68_09950 [Elusimicrobia bacterium]|nr:hypothetical protein [Candidatus Liberimonas magnetica]